MIYVCLVLCLCFHSILGQQFYDRTLCSSHASLPGTRYNCNSTPAGRPCRTFVVYRANDRFPTITTISNLFNVDSDSLLSINGNVSGSNEVLQAGREVLVPVLCSCAGNFSQANFTYKANDSGGDDQNVTLSEIACGIFQGLVKSVTLSEENNILTPKNKTIHVPLKCACPGDLRGSNGEAVKYLITYPFIGGDSTTKLSEKFNVSVEEIWRVNNMDDNPTVYPTTTVLVPVGDEPRINFNISSSDPPAPQFLPTTPVAKPSKASELKNVYIIGSVVGFSLILALLLACGLYIRALNKLNSVKIVTNRVSSINSCSTPMRSSTNSCLSPDFLAGIKYSLRMYTMEEIKRATRNFDRVCEIDDGVYKGLVDDDRGEVMIKRLRFKDTRRAIDVHSKINHVNILKLNGVCYGEDDFSWSYLVFEFPSNGSLRDCLLCSSALLHWNRRTQIAFDVAMGLHYLHYSVVPGYTHTSVSSQSVFLNSSWRAKLAVFGSGEEYSGPTRGCVAPEHVAHATVSEKVDVFAFGVVLLELISGKGAVDGKLLRDSIRFEGGCFDELRRFVDPCLKDDYPVAEALCLAVLGGSCIEDDPLHRPSMDDVIKILARMV